MKNRKKNILALILLIFFLINIIAVVAPVFFARAADEIKIYLNEKELKADVNPFISNSRVLVPIRMIFEAMDAEVLWDAKESKVTIKSTDKEFVFTIDSNIVYINDKKHTLDVKAMILFDRTFIPLRFLAENIDMSVEWSDEERSVYIKDKDEEKAAEKDEGKKEETKNDNNDSKNDEYINLVGISLSKAEIAAEFDKAEIEYKKILLEEPERLVIDISNCVNNSNSVKYEETEYYSGFRFAQFSTEPMITRIVIELSEYDYEIEVDENELSIIFGDEKEAEEDEEEEKKHNDKLKTVVLDAGHGGKDPGALGYEGDEIVLNEKDVNLDIAMKVYKMLKKEDINVYITREEDKFLELSEIVEFANSKKADLFVSIHNNASENTAASGTMTMYAYDKAKEGHSLSGKEFGKIMQKHLVKATKGKDFGPVKNSSLYVVRNTTMPAVITESLFITNEKDREKLLDKDYINEIATAIYKGIMEALEVI